MAEVFRQRWRAFGLSLTAAAVITAALIAVGSASAASGYTITGTVTNASNAPISGATVTVYDEYEESNVAEVKTSATGTYTVTVPSSSDYYSVSASDSGYVDNETAVQFSGTATTVAAPTIALDPAAFFGTVTDAASSGVLDDQEVYLYQDGSEYDETTTDANGYWAFPSDDFTTGNTYSIGYPADLGYATAYYETGQPDGTTSSTSATEFTTAQATSLNTALTLAAGEGEISGTITDAAGAVAGGTVDVYQSTASGLGTYEGTTTTSSTGTYVVSGLAPGSYVVEATGLEGSDDTPTYSGNAGDPYSASTVTVPSAGGNVTSNITLNSGGTVSGTIVNSSNTGIAGIEVDIDDAAGNAVAITDTGAGGTYSVAGLPAGNYYVFFNAEGVDQNTTSNYASQWYGATAGASNSLDQSSATAEQVTAGSSTTVNQTLGTGGEITGTIKDAASGAGLSGYVALYDAAGNPIEDGEGGYDYYDTGDTGATAGQFTFYGLPAGTYYVGYDGGYESYNATTHVSTPVNDADAFYGGSSPAESLGTATAIAVTPGSSAATANVSLPAAGAIQGTVTANGKAQSGVTVELYDSAGNLIQTPYDTAVATTGDDGTYQISGLLPGSYKVEFTASGANLAYQYYNDVSTLSAASTVTVTSSAITKSINAALSAGGEITGTVTDASSKADLAGVDVAAEDANGDVLASTTTRTDGTYTLAGLDAGTYYIEFAAGGVNASKYQVQYYGGKQVLAGSTTVSVTQGSTASGINAALVAANTANNGSTTITNSVAPSITGSAPTITGTAKVGYRLTAKVVGWTAGTTYGYQWYAAGKAIAGATASTYKLAAGQYRKAVTVVVTGKLSGYNWLTEASKATKAVVAGTLATKVPKISGTATVGDKLTAKPGVWTAGTKFTYQWYANKKAIKGATKSTFRLAKVEKGKTITVKVTGRLTGYTSAAKTSKATKKVA